MIPFSDEIGPTHFSFQNVRSGHPSRQSEAMRHQLYQSQPGSMGKRCSANEIRRCRVWTGCGNMWKIYKLEMIFQVKYFGKKSI